MSAIYFKVILVKVSTNRLLCLCGIVRRYIFVYDSSMKQNLPSTPNIKHVEQKVLTGLVKSRDSAYTKFPLLFTLLGTFGVVATFYGFEHIIDGIPILANNPIILLVVGVTTLAITGTLYKKLG